MSKFRIERVTQIPPLVSPSTMYIVKSSEFSLADVYFSNLDGTEVRHLITKAEIAAMIDQAVLSANSMVTVANIAARNAKTYVRDTFVFVTDATGDPSVVAGAAMYMYNLTTDTFTKVSEYESMDLVLNWDNIQGRPSSNPGDIDSAVSMMHAHANSAILQKLGASGDVLTYNNKIVGSTITYSEW